jgi:hypothetical protein
LITGEGAQEAAQKAPVAANTFTDSEDEFEFAAPASNNKNLPSSQVRLPFFIPISFGMRAIYGQLSEEHFQQLMSVSKGKFLDII